MKRIAFIYPYLTSYILPAFQGIAESGRVKLDVIYAPPPSGEGFGEHLPFEHPNVLWIQVEEKRPLGNRLGIYQKGILRYLLRERPDSVLIWANPRYLSFWSTLLAGKLMGIPVYPRGHGLIKYPRPTTLQRLMYKIILFLSKRYVCYTPKVQESLIPLIKTSENLVVDNNTLYNMYPVMPNEKMGQERGIFYIGRVRQGCGVDVLIGAVKRLNQQEGFNIELQIIGDGPMGEFLREQASKFAWVKYHGKIFDLKKISDISRQCRLGCVPGFMGLNVVHMMSLSLPVVTHAQLDQHMGPEPEYIQHQMNGWLVKEPNMEDTIMKTLKTLWQLPVEKTRTMQANAYETYNKLSNPPFHERLLDILEE